LRPPGAIVCRPHERHRQRPIEERDSMLKPKEIEDITQALWYLPLDKLPEVRALVFALKERHGYDEPIDDSDEWTEEDERDFSRATWQRLEEEDPSEEPGDA
jgi:hypothetical protein